MATEDLVYNWGNVCRHGPNCPNKDNGCQKLHVETVDGAHRLVANSKELLARAQANGVEEEYDEEYDYDRAVAEYSSMMHQLEIKRNTRKQRTYIANSL